MSESKTIKLPYSEMEPDRIVTFRCDYWDIIDPPTAEQRANTKASIEEHGVLDPITTCSIMEDLHLVIDGYNRLTIAAELELYADDLKIDCIGEDQGFEEEELRAKARSLNEDRRQLSEEYQARMREERRARVAAARFEQGKSLRTIAAEEGISLGQVQRDLSGVSGDTPETVKGLDGKTYQAKQPPREVPTVPSGTVEEIPQPEEEPTSERGEEEPPTPPSLLISRPEQRTGAGLFDWMEEHQAEQRNPLALDAVASPEPGEKAPEPLAPLELSLQDIKPKEPIVRPPAPRCQYEDAKGACPRLAYTKEGYCTEHHQLGLEQSVDAALAKAGPLDPKTLLPVNPPKTETAGVESSTPAKKESWQHYNSPEWLLVPIRKVSPIALDPFHNQWSVVKAELCFTKEEDGLREDRNWAELTKGKGQVYANPPYENPLPIAQRFVLEAKRGAELTSCLPTSHSTKWYKLLRKNCQAYCQLNRKVDFGKEGVFEGTAFHESTLFYFGPQASKWRAAMASIDPKTEEPYGEVFEGAAYVVPADPRQRALPMEAPSTPKQEAKTCLNCGECETTGGDVCDECALDGIQCALCFGDIEDTKSATLLTPAGQGVNAAWSCAGCLGKEADKNTSKGEPVVFDAEDPEDGDDGRFDREDEEEPITGATLLFKGTLAELSEQGVKDPDAVGPRANRALTQLDACLYREDYTEIWNRLVASAATPEEGFALDDHYNKFYFRLPHRGNVKPEHLTPKEEEQRALYPCPARPRLHRVLHLMEAAYPADKWNLRIDHRNGDFCVTFAGARATLPDQDIKPYEGKWHGSAANGFEGFSLTEAEADEKATPLLRICLSRVKASYIDKGFERIKACTDIGDAFKIYDELIDKSKNKSDEIKDIRERFSAWKLQHQQAPKKKASAPAPKRNRGKNEEPIKSPLKKKKAGAR